MPSLNAKQNRNHGELAQLGERMVRNHEARGSIPLFSTIEKQMGFFPVCFSMYTIQ
jgi:hypothetical protein